MTIKSFHYPEVKSLAKVAKKLVVFLHGYGSYGNDLIPISSTLQKELPDAYFIAPHGIEAYELSPDNSQARQWFSLKDLTPAVLRNLVEKSSNKLQEIILDKQKELNLSNKETILIGFSQGTMLALQSTLSQKTEPFAAMVGFSGLLIYPQNCINTKTPICLIHGQEDNVIDISQMDLAKKYFDAHNIDYETLSIPSLKHTINTIGINKAIEFIIKNTKM